MNNPDTLTLRIGEVRQITLPSRGATGLQLQCEVEDDRILEVQRRDLRPEDLAAAQSTNIGGAVPAIFDLRPRQPGTTRITFFETRPWQPDFPRIIQRQLHVTVTAAA